MRCTLLALAAVLPGIAAAQKTPPAPVMVQGAPKVNKADVQARLESLRQLIRASKPPSMARPAPGGGSAPQTSSGTTSSPCPNGGSMTRKIVTTTSPTSTSETVASTMNACRTAQAEFNGQLTYGVSGPRMPAGSSGPYTVTISVDGGVAVTQASSLAQMVFNNFRYTVTASTGAGCTSASATATGTGTVNGTVYHPDTEFFLGLADAVMNVC
jgi:hypothetical protein